MVKILLFLLTISTTRLETLEDCCAKPKKGKRTLEVNVEF